MGLRRIIVLLVAVVVAGATAMYARSWIEGQQNNITVVAAPAPEKVYEVLVADANLPAGLFVKPQHLRWQRWPTDATSSNSGLIFPGDRVDLILTHSLAAADGTTTRRVSETVLRDIRIIAMGVETSDEPGV